MLGRLQTLLLLVAIGVKLASAWRSCPAEEGGGTCPDRNTCCPTPVNGISSCITGPIHPHNGTSICCTDDGMGVSGCGPGYQCASTTDESGKTQLYCQLQEETPEVPTRLPRYQLGHVHEDSFKHVHYLPVNPDSPKLAYYSTMNSLDAMDAATVARRKAVRTALVIIHGSVRNADDYLSCAAASVPHVHRDETIVLTPRFLAPVDTTNTTNVLEWNEEGPILHTWRYGANAINTTISSYQAMDVLVEQFFGQKFPNLKHIVVAGHSAGGQFTHRWAMTSGSHVWNHHTPRIRVVVANPRSFCYLDNRRYVDGTLQVPSRDTIASCPGYNQWQWGFDSGGPLACPYKDRALKKVGGSVNMAVRYSLRDVVYIAGELDTLQMEGSCEADNFQGPNRRVRSKLYFDSLNELYPLHLHRRLVASGVPHDHCLIFQSDVLRETVWGK